MRRTLISLTALSLFAHAEAATVKPLNLTQQAKKADVIVRATLGPREVVKLRSLVFDVYPLKIEETIAGTATTVPQHKGKPALFILKGTQDLPSFAPNQEAYILLYAKIFASPLVGFNQGYYPINDGKVQAENITEATKLRDALRAARGKR